MFLLEIYLLKYLRNENIKITDFSISFCCRFLKKIKTPFKWSKFFWQLYAFLMLGHVAHKLSLFDKVSHWYEHAFLPIFGVFHLSACLITDKHNSLLFKLKILNLFRENFTTNMSSALWEKELGEGFGHFIRVKRGWGLFRVEQVFLV
jgi:hypothetical protein